MIFFLNPQLYKVIRFILPFTLGATVGRKLFEQKNAGLQGFNESGYEELKDWLIEMEEIDDAMCY